ncbi:TPA: LOW QUALITY PROTEIN: hypothetical protein N0F65_011185 [Lagenidium giganteum]|uniref:Uncharacterized protein n=1 Tax=Lagenidium giganteum TaxID=4803 RepID=A0AAV2ZA42_9STRA|nr:TPA: LOW QUALITY PROTEIN: hypothetical protein N0F65_011185 [Lagenidium giganteum]
MAMDTAGSEAEAAPTAKQTKRKKRNTNLSRDRMKQEIVYLRKKAAKLEEMLQRLQNGERVLMPSSDDQWLPPPPESVSSEVVSRSSPKRAARNDNASMWENIAMRQLLQRERSEAENTRLKESVKKQIRIVQTMEKILFRRVNSEICDDSAHNGKRLCSFSRHDSTAIEEMLSELDNLYLQTNAVFELHKMSQIETDEFDVRINTSSPLFPNLPLGMCVLTTCTMVFPFTFHKTGHANWKLLESLSAASSRGRTHIGHNWYLDRPCRQS